MLTYLATPYSSYATDPWKKRIEQHSRFMEAQKITADLMNRGFAVFCPIVHCHQLAVDFNLPGDAAYWEEYNKHFMDAASLFVVADTMEGWFSSKGVQAEIDYVTLRNTGLRLYSAILKFNVRADKGE